MLSFKLREMTPEEKANELVERFKVLQPHEKGKCIDPMMELYEIQAKQCALICVDEILKAIPNAFGYYPDNNDLESEKDYWQEIKQEIEKL